MPMEPKFWLNLVVVFLATLWVPILNINVTDADGNTAQRMVPMYHCYQYLVLEPSPWFAAAVALHLLVVVGVSLAVRHMLKHGPLREFSQPPDPERDKSGKPQ